ncbi:unnamed protein product [Oikopleura dioica]|uniref:Uncharacterized protein n=1 Tax=Oikopleura dioica TaxID=34765 RepID=E4Z2X9_OIKDI|nr:unnamed protein product [Oikopleura dioica]
MLTRLKTIKLGHNNKRFNPKNCSIFSHRNLFVRNDGRANDDNHNDSIPTHHQSSYNDGDDNNSLVHNN